MEIFFFLSLGITFVLILLIVYHFKQRITTMEHKSDTMFDIVQNLAKEISAMKVEQHARSQFGGMSGGICTMPFHPMSMGGGGGPFRFAEEEDNDANLESSAVEELDDNEESCGDSGEDSDDEEECDDSDDEDVEEPFTKIKVSEDDNEIQVTEDELLETIPEVAESSTQDSIVVTEEAPLVEEQSSAEPQPPSSTVEDEYKKLSLNDLKKLAATKGIQKDINKLKRQELIKLLQQQQPSQSSQ